MKPRAILIDLFGDHLRYHGGEARLQVLSELLMDFGVGESTTRVALSRMRRDGWFATRREGRETVYVLTEHSWQVLDEGRQRIFERDLGSWDGAWRMAIYAVPESARTERERIRRTLAWHGFGPLASATWVSPHDRLEEIAAALADSSAIRLDLLTCRSRGRAADLEMAARCWDLDALGRDYEKLVGRYEDLLATTDLAALPGDQALRLRVELVAEYRGFPFRDPDLPVELLPGSWLGRRAHELFVAAHDALRAPADAHVREVLDRAR